MKKWKEIKKEGYNLIVNQGGKTVAYSKESNIKIIEKDGYAFKNLSKSGKVEKYEDWRLPVEERAKDLASKMTIKQIAGLMLYSVHQAVSTGQDPFSKMFQGIYDGKKLEESNASIEDLSDQQKDFLENDDLRHVLVTIVDNAKTSAKWNNNLQAYGRVLLRWIPNIK